MRFPSNTGLLVGLTLLAAQGQGADPATQPAKPVETVADTFSLAPPGSVQLQGRLGGKLDLCLNQRVWGKGAEKILPFFRDQNDNGNWRGEYWGKWFTAAVLAYAYQPMPERLARLEHEARDLIKTQDADGYLGTYNAEHRLTVWDVWCRKYVLLGLIVAYDVTGDKSILEAARREADNLIAEVQRKKIKIVDVGVDVLQGVAHSSIIEPIALLYQHTGQKKYLEFAQSIIAQWDAPSKAAPQGTHLMENALAGLPPMKNHAYAIMSCFEGICELYRATGDRRYLKAAVRFGQSVRKYERMIDGSVSNHELFCDGVRNQTEFLEKPQETCATVTWIKLCAQLLRLTGDPVWADEMELSLYNAMVGAMTPDGEWFSYFTQLTGERVPSFIAHADLNLSCCVASGPRGLLLTPRWAVMTARGGPVVNLYAPGSARLPLADGSAVKIIQETDYPVGDQVKMTIVPEGKRHFSLCLRIPAWSKHTALSVNGKAVRCEPGTYAKLARKWSAGDRVLLKLDLRSRAVPAPSGAPQVALMRGPILLALDNRLVPPSDVALWLAPDTNGLVELKPHRSNPEWAWMSFEVPFQVRPSHFFGHYTTNLALCDFASAGNAWSETNLYRVWLPQPLLLSQAYATNTWKLLHPGPGWPLRRPVNPAAAPKLKEHAGKFARKLIEFGWDEPDTAFLRKHIAEMEQWPFDGCVFHVNYIQPDGRKGNFTWECWGKRSFTPAELASALEDLKATPHHRFDHNFLRFNVTPGNVDWFDDFSAILQNARLAARLAREGQCAGILFDIEHYGAKPFKYRAQRDAAEKSWEVYASQARRRGRELMEAFEEEFPAVTVFLTYGYSLPWAQSDSGKKPLAEGDYGLLAPFLDGMIEAANRPRQIIDGCELSYSFKDSGQFRQSYKMMKEDLLPIVADAKKYQQVASLGFGLWLDFDWRKRGWKPDQPSANYFTPEGFAAIVRHALEAADEYVWVYSETPRWWSDQGKPVQLPEAYIKSLRHSAVK